MFYVLDNILILPLSILIVVEEDLSYCSYNISFFKLVLSFLLMCACGLNLLTKSICFDGLGTGIILKSLRGSRRFVVVNMMNALQKQRLLLQVQERKQLNTLGGKMPSFMLLSLRVLA